MEKTCNSIQLSFVTCCFSVHAASAVTAPINTVQGREKRDRKRYDKQYDRREDVKHPELQQIQLKRSGPQVLVAIFDHVFDHSRDALSRRVGPVSQYRRRQFGSAPVSWVRQDAIDVRGEFRRREGSDVHADCIAFGRGDCGVAGLVDREWKDNERLGVVD